MVPLASPTRSRCKKRPKKQVRKAAAGHDRLARACVLTGAPSRTTRPGRATQAIRSSSRGAGWHRRARKHVCLTRKRKTHWQSLLDGLPPAGDLAAQCPAHVTVCSAQYPHVLVPCRWSPGPVASRKLPLVDLWLQYVWRLGAVLAELHHVPVARSQ